MSTELPTLTSSISYHSWNKDRSMIAISPNTNEIIIYKTNGSDDVTKWNKLHTLEEHGGQVSCIDWHPDTNLIVSCGHDRNAYVWKYDELTSVWKPELVILRINRAATCVKWSPDGKKFAVGSGAKSVPICYYEESNNWWISKMLKKHKSSILSVAWCPNNKFLLTGSSDMKCRVFSAYIEGLDSEADDGFGEVFPKQHEFGEVLAEFDQGKSWIHSVAWAPGGFRLAFGSHGSTISFVQLLGGSTPIVQTLFCKDLPYIDIQFLSDNTVVAAGFEMNIDVFTVSGGSDAEPVWSFKDKVDKKEKAKAAAPAAASSGGFGAARAMFQSTVNQGTKFGDAPAANTITTKHTNIITNIWFAPSADNSLVSKFTTSSLDGRVLVWDISSMGCK